MSANKTFFGKIFASMGEFFHNLVQDLFNSLTKAYNALPTSQQDALKNGSGIIALINDMLTSAPADVATAIEQTYHVDATALLDGLNAICKAYGLTPPSADINGAIAAIQAKLTASEGIVWDSIMGELAKILAYYLGGGATIWGVIAMLMEYVYQTFIKKDS